MQQPQMRKLAVKLDAEKQRQFRGSARIRLEFLHFSEEPVREVDRKNVERLKSCYGDEGCHQWDPRYRVNAVIDERNLQNAIQFSRTSLSALLSSVPSERPQLYFPSNFRLRCLNGQHRIQAAREFLAPDAKWWIVDIYLNNLSDELNRFLTDDYTNEKQFTDGEICRNILINRRSHNAEAEGQWWARLQSKDKKKEMKRLLGRVILAAAFGSCLDIPGLWHGMRLGTIGSLLRLKCDEELIHAINHVGSFWARLLQNKRTAMLKVDQTTVEAVELRAPAASLSDRANLYDRFRKGDIFSAFTEQDRYVIWNELQSHDGLIPSIYSFLEDFKYFELCAQCVKKLFHLSFRETLRRAMQFSLLVAGEGRDQCIIQEAEHTFVSRSGDQLDRADIGYRELFLYVMRHLNNLLPGSTLIERDESRTIKEPDSRAWYELASLARRLGFESTEITNLLAQNPDRVMARESLLRARKPGLYNYDDARFESFLDQITNIYSSAVEVRSEPLKPAFVVADRGEDLKRRCGRPFDQAYEESRKFLFLPNMHSTDKSQAEGITPFYVRRSVYLAFFGELTTDESMNQSINPVNGGPSRAAEERAGEGSAAEASAAEQRVAAERVAAEERAAEERAAEERAAEERAAERVAAEERAAEERAAEERAAERVAAERVAAEERAAAERAAAERMAVEKGAERVAELEGHFDPESELPNTPNEIIFDNLPRNWGSAAPSRISPSHYSIESGVQEALPPTETHDVEDGTEERPKMRIQFVLRHQDDWVDMEELAIHPSESSLVERVAQKHASQGRFPFSTGLKTLAPSTCVRAVVRDGTGTILLIPEGQVKIDRQLYSSVSRLLARGLAVMLPTLKRVATEDISEQVHMRKKPWAAN